MNNELLQKIQEKLGSAIDLINLENTEKVYNYAISYVKTEALASWLIVLAILIVSVVFTIFAYIKSDHGWKEEWNCATAVGIVFSGVVFIFLLIFTYDLIMTNLYPAIKVMKWLK